MSLRRGNRYTAPPGMLSERFIVHEPIGAGGMATVYRVVDTQNDEELAAKVLDQAAGTRSSVRTRFVNEARTMAAFAHPNIIGIRHVGTDRIEGRAEPIRYFVMELAPRGSLHKRMRRHGVIPPRTALRYTFEILAALSHAHAAGVVHRDVKPQNMLFDADDRIKLTDFGIARADTSGARITNTGDVLGTASYMAPEQRLDPRNVAPAADLYSVGATLYAMLTGRKSTDLPMARLDPSVLADVPLEIRSIVRRSTANRAEDRHRSAAAMAHAVLVALVDLGETLDPDQQMAEFPMTWLPVLDELPSQLPPAKWGSVGGPKFS